MTEPPRVTPTGPRADAGADRILFIGTATTLIQAAGFTILTDPNFLHRGDRACLGMGLTTKRGHHHGARQGNLRDTARAWNHANPRRSGH